MITPTRFGYIAFYDNHRLELYATSVFNAMKQAVSFFNPPKSKRHMVHVYLAET